MMAVEQDYEACREAWTKWGQIIVPTWVVGCSLNIAQLKLLREVLPNASVTDVDQRQWNLNERSPKPEVDVVVACNVFHYSDNPTRWFANIFASSKYLWLQDLFCRRRGKDREFGNDGDCMRYGLGGVAVVDTVPMYDLSVFEDRLMDYKVYDAGSFANRRTTINFVALLRGDVK